MTGSIRVFSSIRLGCASRGNIMAQQGTSWYKRDFLEWVERKLKGGAHLSEEAPRWRPLLRVEKN